MMSLPCMDTHSLLPSSIAAPLECAYTSYLSYAEACPSAPFTSLDDQSTSSAPPCRKRRAISDLSQEFSQFHDGWKLNDELAFDAHSFPLLINGDPLQLALNDNHPPNPSLFSAFHKCSDLEDVLDFLWMEDDTASTTQSASSPLASSDQMSLINDLDWDYGTNESSSNQGESNDNPSSDNLQSLEVNQEGLNFGEGEGSLIFNWEKSLQKKEAHGSEIWATLQHKKIEATRASWQGETRGSWQEKQGEQRASWQQKKQGEIRASWQDEIRASWQPKQAGARASWKPEGEIRASWQEGQNRASWQAQGGRCKQEGAISASEKQRNGAWAGPTLLDIESALALNSASPINTSPLSSFSPIASPSPLSNPKHNIISSFFDVKKLLSDDVTKGTGEQDCLDSSWRLKLQKRNSLEPKYTVKVESEEKALGDGYRWRKYGQKTIKNSPFPRSYYRCSSGKCSAKKQVEKCHEDAGIFLVTYEGIHLHHRPNPLHKFRTLGDLHDSEKEKSSSQLCSPSSSTSCSYSIPPICSPSSNHTLLT